METPGAVSTDASTATMTIVLIALQIFRMTCLVAEPTGGAKMVSLVYQTLTV